MQTRYIALLLFISLNIVAQKDKTSVGTEVVTIVKPYSATISDAFKIKEIPTLEDEETSKRETINYTIFSFPVASTFSPAKGRAAAVEKSKQDKYFTNYVSLAYGNYATPIGELYLTHNLNNREYIGAMLRHHSSGGGIGDVKLDDGFSNSSIDVFYGNQGNKLSYNLNLGYLNQQYNWYGLPNFISQYYSDTELPQIINSIAEEQKYNTFHLGGSLSAKDSFFNGLSLHYFNFSDGLDSAENQLVAKPSFTFDINEFEIKSTLIVDHVSGSFKRNYLADTPLDYGFTNIGFQPSLLYNKEDLSIKAGISIFYSLDAQNDGNQFLFYPNIFASYKLVGDLMTFYAGADGELQQNTYREFAQQNPFVSPTLLIAPTDRQYDLFAGLKGKLASQVSYNVRASYLSEKNRALFVNNGFDPTLSLSQGYSFGNSFSTVYDNLKTISLFGELTADFSKQITWGINGRYNIFSTDVQAEAWNLPTLEITSQLEVEITPKWFTGVKVFFMGERKDNQFVPRFTTDGTNLLVFQRETQSLKSFFDANFHLGYKHNERLTGFFRINNIANQQYQRWLNFPVQGIQVLLGASYKFDF